MKKARKRCMHDVFLLHTFTGTLACYKLVYFYLFLVAVHVIFPYVVCIWERAENLKQGDDKGAEGLHPEKQTEKECHWRWKQPATHACKQMKATCHTCLQASLHKHKAAGDNNERQQENEESGQKITDEYCSRNRWMEIDIEQLRALEEANQNKPDAETFLQQTQDQSQRKLILSYLFFQFLLGVRRGRRMKCSSQDAKVFAACELPFYKNALCTFSCVLWQL